MIDIRYSGDFDYWLKSNGITIIEQCNYSQFIAFHSWVNKGEMPETSSTVAIWTVKKKVL